MGSDCDECQENSWPLTKKTPNCSQIFRRESGVSRNAAQHARANLFVIVEPKHVCAAFGMLQLYMRPSLGDDDPTLVQQRAQHNFGFRARPRAQADLDGTLIDSGILFDFSTSSAME